MFTFYIIHNSENGGARNPHDQNLKIQIDNLVELQDREIQEEDTNFRPILLINTLCSSRHILNQPPPESISTYID